MDSRNTQTTATEDILEKLRFIESGGATPNSNLTSGRKRPKKSYESESKAVVNPKKESKPHFDNGTPKLKDNHKDIGTKVSKETADELEYLSNKELGGRRATIIIRREYIEKEKPKPKEKRKLSLVRCDTGELYELDKSVSIGKDRTSGIVLDERYISRTHAYIEVMGFKTFLRDNHSTNKTYLNGKSIDKEEIKEGDHIRFANLDFEVIGRD